MIVIIVIAFFAGFYLGFSTVIFLKNREIKKFQKEVEGMFSLILSNFKNMNFTKRINRYAYFTFNNWEIIYQLDNKSIHIFSKEVCIATSTQLDNKKVINNLLKKIDNEWGSDINNTVNINNSQVSINYVQSQMSQEFSDPLIESLKAKEEESFTVDDVLDKINKVGYNNLTEEEKEFLKNASK